MADFEGGRSFEGQSGDIYPSLQVEVPFDTAAQVVRFYTNFVPQEVDDTPQFVRGMWLYAGDVYRKILAELSRQKRNGVDKPDSLAFRINPYQLSSLDELTLIPPFLNEDSKTRLNLNEALFKIRDEYDAKLSKEHPELKPTNTIPSESLEEKILGRSPSLSGRSEQGAVAAFESSIRENNIRPIYFSASNTDIEALTKAFAWYKGEINKDWQDLSHEQQERLTSANVITVQAGEQRGSRILISASLDRMERIGEVLRDRIEDHNKNGRIEEAEKLRNTFKSFFESFISSGGMRPKLYFEVIEEARKT